MDPISFLKAVDAGDVGTIQGGEDLGFVLEPGEAFRIIRIIREKVRQDFEGHIPVEFDVPGSIHLSHPALTDEGGDFIRPEAGADAEGHVLTRLSLFRTLLCTSTAQSERGCPSSC